MQFKLTLFTQLAASPEMLYFLSQSDAIGQFQDIFDNFGSFGSFTDTNCTATPDTKLSILTCYPSTGRWTRSRLYSD